MARILKELELKDIIVGTTFMGSGGGGSPKDALRLLDELQTQGKVEVKLLSPDEMADGELAPFIAEFGSPVAFQQAKAFPELVASWEMMLAMSALSGINVRYLIPAELGGFNTFAPMYVAALTGVPVIDGDGCGRAVPELATTLYAYAATPNFPLTMAGYDGRVVDKMAINLGDPRNIGAGENMGRHICMAYGMRAAYCGYPVDRETIKTKMVPNSLTLSQDIGRVFREAKDEAALISGLAEVCGSKVMFRGRVVGIEQKQVSGFDLGWTTVEGGGQFQGKRGICCIKNENMMFKEENGPVLSTVPELIEMVDAASLMPLNNSDTEEGMEVLVLATPPARAWLDWPDGFNCWRHILKSFEYEGGYVAFA